MTMPDKPIHRGLRPTPRASMLARHFLRDRSGLSGLEFAILLPLIVMLFAATLDLGEALMVNRRVNQIATTTSDIVTQESGWSNQQLKTLLDGSTSILEPFVAEPATVLVSVLDIDSKGHATVNWSYGYNTTALAAGAQSPVDIPSTIKEPGVQIVVTVVNFEMTTTFTALLSKVTGLDSYQLSSNAFARPRVGDTVEHK